MIKQPLKEYLEKHIEYIPNSEYDPTRRWVKSTTYNKHFELIKRDFYGSYKIYILSRLLFQRYMNDSYWTWENG